MGLLLKSMKKQEEAKEAFADAVAAHTKALDIIASQQKSGKPVPGHILEKLTLSLEKHKEVLTGAGEDTKGVDVQLEKILAMPMSK